MGVLAARRMPERANEHPHVAPEIDHDGEQAADMNRDIEQGALVFPGSQKVHQVQMTGRTDRQKLRQPLYDGEKYQLFNRHSEVPAVGVPGGLGAFTSYVW